MKKILLFIIAIAAFGNLMNAQQQNDSTAIQKVESPVIVVKLPLYHPRRLCEKQKQKQKQKQD